MAIKLITDSTGYIPESLLKEHNIEVMPLMVNFEDESFLDLASQCTSFYEKLAQVDYIPKSSQPSTGNIMEAFESAIKAGDDVIGVFLSAKMSGTFNTACMIKQQLSELYPKAKIAVIDSTTNCMQMGHVVLAGAKAIAANERFEDVVEKITKTIPRTRFIFSPSTLEYLKRGGRIGSAAAFLGQILQVKPILTVREGMTTSLNKVRTRKKAIHFMLDTFIKDIEEFGIANVIIHHIEDIKAAERVKELFEHKIGIKDVEIIDIGPVIGTHVGPGAIGIAYETKEDIIL